MAAIIEIEATVTERGQTTLPAAIRTMLRLEKRGSIIFHGMDDGTVVITKKITDQEDPVLGRFLAFLASDMASHPEGIRPVTHDVVERIRDLVGDIDIDLDAALPDDCE
jgi:antitoxin PrlF